MASERRLTVVLAGDAKGLTSALGKAETATGRFGGKLGGLSGKAKVALAGATAAVTAFAGASINAGSDLSETLSKSNTVFGEQAGAIEKWASSASSSIGQSKQQALEAASSFGNMFTQLGVGEQQAAAMSTQMTALASDFASFHNSDITEVLTAQQAAFRGEYDALQRFVPTINAAAVEQEALRQTGKKTTKELTAQEKALAVQTLMMKGAGDAQGDFARTSDGLANKQRILSAKFADFQANVGQKLIPVLLRLMEVGEGVARFIGGLSPEMKVAIGVVAGLAGAVFVIVKAVKAWQAAQMALNVVLAMNPIGAIVLAVAAFVAGIVLAYQKVGWFRNLVDGAFRLIKNVIMGAFNWVKQNWPLLLAILTGPIGLAVLTITKHWNTIKAGVSAVKDWIVGQFNAVVSFLGGLRGRIAGMASNTWNALKNGLSAAVRWVLNQLDRLLGPLDEIAGKVGGVVGKLGGAIGKIPGFASGVSNFGGGLAVVGERGPELVNLPRGSDVIPMSPLSAGGVGASMQPVPVVIELDGQVLGRAMIRFDADHRSRNGRSAFGG